MNTLLVQNDNRSPELLENIFARHNVQVIPWSDLQKINLENFDMAVLSGSSAFPIAGNEKALENELNLIRSSSIPILGICYGFELIVVAFGGTLKKLPEKEQGVFHVNIAEQDPIFNGIDDLFVYEGHRWIADSLSNTLVPLAESSYGIEAVRHIDRPIYGLQFHPEKLEKETSGGKIIQNFLTMMHKK